jgi:hypothetical protein
VAALKVQFAKAITLGVAIAEVLEKPALHYVEPVLRVSVFHLMFIVLRQRLFVVGVVYALNYILLSSIQYFIMSHIFSN